MNYSNRFIYLSRLYEKSYGLFPKTQLTFVIYLLLILIGFMAHAQSDLSLPKDKTYPLDEYTHCAEKKRAEVSHLPNGSFGLQLHSSNNETFIHKLIKQ